MEAGQTNPGASAPRCVAELFIERRPTTHSTGARIAGLSCARLGLIGGSSRPVNSSVGRFPG